MIILNRVEVTRKKYDKKDRVIEEVFEIYYPSEEIMDNKRIGFKINSIPNNHNHMAKKVSKKVVKKVVKKVNKMKMAMKGKKGC